MSRFTFWFGSRTRLVVAGIAALTLAGSVAAALLVGGSPKSSHAQVVGNLDVGVLVSEQASDGRQQIVVIDHPGAKARTVGTADKFSSIRFAPNAKTVAALAPGDGPGAQASLHLIDAATGRERVVQFPSAALASAVAWSPNSNSVAVVGAIAYLVSREGAVTATAAATASADASSSSLASGGYQWSPDGAFFVALVNADVVILRTDGQSAAVAGSQLIPNVQPRFFLAGWVEGEGPVLSHDGSQILAVVRGVSVAATGTEGRTITPPVGLTPVSPEVRAAAAAAVAGGVVVWSRSIDDGRAVIAEVRDIEGNGRIVVVSNQGVSRVAQLTNFDAKDSRGGGLLDAVVNP